MTFEQYLTKSSKEIHEALQRQLHQWQLDANKKTENHLSKLLEHFEESVFGGKRLRGTFVTLGYELAGGTDFSSILPLAAAMELAHTALLIHDDIIDKSPIRRGKPALYKSIGNNQAMLAGDIGIFLAIESISQSAISAEKRSHIQVLFTNIILGTILGEMLDVAFSENKTNATEEEILLISTLKTARYTVVGPLLVGATAASAPDRMLKNLEQFGEAIGIAFQLRDDIIGVFGDEKTIGKSVTSDVTEGKQTLLLLYALNHATKEQKEILEQHYGKGSVSENVFRQIKNIFQTTGALSYVQERIQSYSTTATTYTPLLTKDEDMQSLLLQIISSLAQ